MRKRRSSCDSQRRWIFLCFGPHQIIFSAYILFYFTKGAHHSPRLMAFKWTVWHISGTSVHSWICKIRTPPSTAFYHTLKISAVVVGANLIKLIRSSSYSPRTLQLHQKADQGGCYLYWVCAPLHEQTKIIYVGGTGATYSCRSYRFDGWGAECGIWVI